MTMIEALREYVKGFPRLSGGTLRVDFLEEDAGSYSVDSIPAKEVVRQYLDGSAQKQYLFVLASRAYYGPHVRQQIDNLAFFEQFSDWLKEQNRLRRFPELGAGRRVQQMEVTSSGYAFYPGTDSARYQIQCRVLYYEKGCNNV